MKQSKLLPVDKPNQHECMNDISECNFSFLNDDGMILLAFELSPANMTLSMILSSQELDQ